MEVATMATLTRASALALLCPGSVDPRAIAHPTQVGLLPVHGTTLFGDSISPVGGKAGALGGGRKLSDLGTKLSGASQTARGERGGNQRATGGVQIARPRTTELTTNAQQPLTVYGVSSLIGMSVFAAKGSLMAKPFAPATVAASGVPPRGRPV
jgi:hypothetical protein